VAESFYVSLFYFVFFVLGAPALFTVIWTLCKALADDKMCWIGGNDNGPAYYVFTVPILVILLVCVYYFVTLLLGAVFKRRPHKTAKQ